MSVLSPEAALGSEEPRQLLAFIQDEATRKVVDQIAADLMVSRASVRKGGIVEATRQLGEQRSPRLLLVDLSGIDLPLSAVNELAEVCEPGVMVIAIGDRNDVGLFRDLIASGISDYLVKPITPGLLQKSLFNLADNGTQSRHKRRLGRLIAVTGARGGVGATMMATGLAWIIAHERRRRVALVDLDLQYGTVALALDLEPSHGLREALEHPSRIDSLFVDRAMVKHSETLYVLSSEENLDEHLLPEETALDIILKELRNKFNYVIVDVPRQISPCTQHILQTATDLVLVTDLSLAGMRDTLRQISILPSMNAACQLTVVANRTGEHKEGEIGQREFEAGIGRSINLVVPFDAKSVAAAINVGRPVADGRGKVAAAMHQLADRMIGSGGSTASRSPRFSFWPVRR